MKKIIKVLCFAMTAVMLLACLFGCKKKKEEVPNPDTQVTTVTEPTETKAIDASGLEKRDFGGKSMKIWYSFGVSSWSPYPLNVTDEENATGDIVMMAGFARNDKLQNDYNVKLEYTVSQTNPNNTSDEKKSEVVALRNLHASGDISEYDMVMVGTTTASTLAIEDFFYDLSESAYIKPDAYYYESNVNKQIRLKGHQYFASGYYSVKNTAAIDVTYVNTKIVNDYAHLTVNDLYELVLDHQWTLDRMLEIGNLYASVNNTGDYLEDQYSLILSSNYCQNVFYDLGGKVIEYNEGTSNYDVVIANDTNQSLLTLIQSKITSDPKVGLVKNNKHLDAFKNESSPFMIVTYYNLTNLKDSNLEYTILPPPLLSAGNDYLAYSDQWNLNFSGIPKSANDLDKADYLYEVFMCYSYDYVYPAYYEQCFGVQYQPDETSSQVFDIVAKSRVVCIANIYRLFGLKDVASIVRSTQNGVSSTVSVIKDEVEGNLNVMMGKLGKSA